MERNLVFPKTGKEKGAIAVNSQAALPPWIVLDPLFQGWLLEDIGRGDRTTGSIYIGQAGCHEAQWIAKAPGAMAATGKIPIATKIIISTKSW